MIEIKIRIEQTGDHVHMSATTEHKSPSLDEIEAILVLDKHLKSGLEEIMDSNGGVWAEGKNSEQICRNLFNRNRKS